MNKILALLICFTFVSALAGCGPQRRLESKTPEDVLPEFFGEGRGDVFPEVMVGVWEAEIANCKWAFKFERDGSILKIIHALAGEVDLRQEGVYLEGPDEGTYAVFMMGPCETEYNASKRELTVKIVLDYYQMVLPQGDLEGKSYDYFKGPVSEDGKIWKAEWLSYSWLEGADPPNADAIEAEPIPLVFMKLKIE